MIISFLSPRAVLEKLIVLKIFYFNRHFDTYFSYNNKTYDFYKIQKFSNFRYTFNRRIVIFSINDNQNVVSGTMDATTLLSIPTRYRYLRLSTEDRVLWLKHLHPTKMIQ